MVMDRQLSFVKDLHQACREHGVVPKRVSERPEEWRLAPFTLSVDRRRDRATLRYARRAMTRCLPCDANDVLNACQRVAAKLTAGSLAPDTLLPLLAQAYDTARDADGARVALPEFCNEVARLATDRSEQRRYTRAQLAFDLARLRREQRLQIDGRRIDLGSATGGLAAKKSRVMWIEGPPGTGQYYATFRLMPVRTGESK